MKRVELDEAGKGYLSGIISKGKHAAREIKRAQILLHLGEGETIEETAQLAGVCVATVVNVKRRYFEVGKELSSAISEKPRPGQPAKITAKVEARITAIACSQAPEGSSGWSLRMIRDKAVELELVPELSHETVRRVLKKQAQAVAEKTVVHSRNRRQVPCLDGGNP